MKNKWFKVMGGTIFTVLLIALLIKIPVIEVSYNDSRFFLKGDQFEIGWIHSVEKEPWYETYALKNDQLYLVETRFKTFGAGTPSSGKVLPSTDGFVHMELDQRMDEINFIVSKNVQTTLYTGNNIIPLYEIAPDHAAFVIKNKEIPLWQIIRGDYK
ncbi:DUF1850 domain-containing protein [Mesobacillus subterraneus]|uniref:DUF1850 domain-containing protein n=1 Tax=Mesobacillus subterraneus TaxID=285983 RepID=A0A427TS50_9BACI|nr:DUF1850 domain-containing protein [Mesobacillus subterraneus]RSD27189.1 DUF1850 domain-containing protein [Mesobacillus subterraneus]